METNIDTTSQAQEAANVLAQAAQAAGSSRRITDQITRKVVAQTGADYREAQAAAINAVNRFVTSNRKPYNLDAGYVCSRRNEVNNGWVVIYKHDGQPYQVTCKTHGTSATASSLPKARPFLKQPTFCAGCMGQQPEATVVVEQPTTATSFEGEEYNTATDVTKHSGYIAHQGTATVYDSKAQGIDYRRPRPFSTVCEPHGHFVGSMSLIQAKEFMANTASFCPHCKKLAKQTK